eukprot:TRINITY_DN12942_c0_g1_i1.p1 TRINITY_DN12942_c0_g1~~TRINITY_DN12942_c0_g1_i1.p1  ORF type:complete len:530 (+),score=100.91 TRINITY_DN12942_c0_g1_i1:84-1673(+)
MEADKDLAKTKEETYDRQLRLWGALGQKALENAKVCLINGGATGTEILKNLVLPGVGSYTIVDGNKVTAADLGNNFFIDKASIGSSRAECTHRLLTELNPWVSGSAVSEDPVQLINNKVDYFGAFTIVIATELPEAPLLTLAKFLNSKHIPLFVVRSYGFIGYLRIVATEHTIVESHPDVEEDLRLAEPFPALSAFADSVDLSKLDSHLHSHVPYVVLLLQHVKQWKAAHDGNLPNTREEKNQFKLAVREGQKEEGEPNFQEAIAQAYRISSPTTLSYTTRELIADPSATNLTAQSPTFWILAAALKEFTEANNGLPPVLGSIPDMTADTHSFLALQQVYQQKAQEDIDAVAKSAAAILQRLGRSADEISPEQVKLFCKSAQSLRLVRTSSLEQEYSDSISKDALSAGLDENPGTVSFYLLLRAVDRFYAKHGRYPGSVTDSDITPDVPLLRAEVDGLLTALGLPHTTVSEDYVHEVCRYGASEMHNIGAFLGGIGAQEAIKVITHQWVPLNNTLLYNAITSSTITLAL